MKTILCYGDSNTWGFVPGSFNLETLYMERYSRKQRWTGLLQAQLGDNYFVIEAGLNGRTTNIDYAKLQPSRNGKTFLPTCLYMHAPIDLVILMLGINDLKIEFQRSNEDIAAGISELIRIIQHSTYGSDMQSPPAVLLISNPVLSHEDGFFGQFKGALSRSKKLSNYYEKVAEKRQCHYANAAPHIQFSNIDGIHLNIKGHTLFAKWIAEEVKKIL